MGPIGEIGPSLEKMVIESCKKITDHSALGRLTNLKDLDLHNAGQLDNLDFLDRLPDLSHFSFYNTRVVSGDLSKMLDREWDTFHFNNSRTYTVKKSEIRLKGHHQDIPKQKTKIQGIHSQYFGLIPNTNTNDFYEGQTKLKNKSINLDLYLLEEEQISADLISQVDHFINDLDSHLHSCQAYMITDLLKRGSTLDFFKYIEEQNLVHPTEIDDLIRVESAEAIKELINRLSLLRLGLYPTNAMGAPFAILDFGLSDVNYLLVVKTDEGGNLVEVTWES